MYRWIQHKALRAKYRKYALRISAVVHIIGILVIALLLFFKTDVQELKDAIQVDILHEQHVLIDPPPEPEPIPKFEFTPKEEPPKPEMPVPPEDILQRKDVTLQKAVNVIQQESSLEIAKLPASAAAVDIEQSTSQNIDVDTPILETPDLATDARLEPTEDSILSPNVSGGVDIDKVGISKRGNTSVRSPSKSTGEGIAARVGRTGSGKKNGSGTGETGEGQGNGNGSDTFSSIIAELTDDIIATSGGLPIDVVFVVDASGSMQDNINAVAEHLAQMTDAYKASEIDYRLGLTHFNMVLNSQQNNIQVFQLLQDLSIYKRRLYEIVPTGDENALDAIAASLTQMRFRTNTVKHLIVVTDEPFTSLQRHNVDTIIKLCQKHELYVNVLGNDIPEHRLLAMKTGGSWHAVPQDPMQQTAQKPPATPQTIGDFILNDATNMPVDIIMFIDGSKSMESKTAYVKEQIDLWIRNWDNAMIDYRIGVVRFRAKHSVNMVNVFKTPQTQEQIHKILQLPYQEDENLHQSVIEGIRRLKLRQNVKTHFIFITDEPGNSKQPITGTIGLLKELPVTVSVIGTADTFQRSVAQSTGGVYVKMPKAHKTNSPNQ